MSGKLTWLGHSAFLLTTVEGKRVLLDPFLTHNPSVPEEFAKADEVDDIDLILISHAHMDHVGDTISIARRTGATVGAMVETGDWLEGKQGLEHVHAINKGGAFEHAGIQVRMVNAFHSGSLPDGSYGGEAAGWVITLEDGYRIYFAGDTCVFGDMALIGELYSPDLAMLPIGGYYTMDPFEAAHAVRLLGVEEVLGMHYGTFPPLTGTPDKLRAELHKLGLASSTTVHELTPGGSLPLRTGVTTA
jgi:L-ascorbate metabolism protein UlaG (beta-lactamase superfamily)